MFDFVRRVKSATAPIRREVAGLLAPNQVSYSGEWEDRVAGMRFLRRGIDPPTLRYLDIGAADPIHLSNTYFFYQRGARGVLVEPDIRYARRIRTKRPRDVHVCAGAAFDGRRSAELTLFTNPVFNTFSTEHARMTLTVSSKWSPSQRQRVVDKVDAPLIPANELLQKHFSDGPPHLISIDVEGVSFDVLKSIDFTAFAPLVLCVETEASVGAYLDVIGRDKYEFIYRSSDNFMFARTDTNTS
jgi:FkbM family methyltransferase